MGFPDRIERTLDLPHPPERVWAALTTADGLGTWFGNTADVDLRVGGLIHLAWDSGDKATLTIERLDPPSAVGWTWGLSGLPDGDPRCTYVEFTLEPGGSGTLLSMVESGFAQVSGAGHDKAYGGNTGGWTHELGELVAYLDAQVADAGA
jgi:uncharacterized protein YndB with AHSA1/START domain